MGNPNRQVVVFPVFCFLIFAFRISFFALILSEVVGQIPSNQIFIWGIIIHGFASGICEIRCL